MILQFGRYGVRWEAGRLEFRSSVDEPDRWLVEYAGGHPTASGQTMTERTAMQLAAFFRGVTLVSNSMGIAPCRLYQRTANPEYQPDPQKPDYDPEKYRGRRKAAEHPLDSILHSQPNPEMTAMTFWKTLTGHLLCWGNGYAEIERDNAGRVIALWPLRPDRTFPRRLNNGKLVYAVRSSAGPEVTLNPHEIFHVMGYTYDGLRGLSPVALTREGLGLAMAAQDYGARFFGNDARPGGILTTPQKLSDMGAKRLKNSWEEAHRGGEQSHRVAVLEGDIKWQAIGMPNEDAQWLQSRVFSIGEIARIIGVPPHKLFELSHATFSNIEHQDIEYIRDGVLPWGEACEQEISRKLLMPAEQSVFYGEFNFDAQMRGDLKSRYEAYQIALNNGMRTADQIGELEHWNPQPNGQGKVNWVPVTQQPVQNALAGKPTPGDVDPDADPDKLPAKRPKPGDPAEPGIRKPGKARLQQRSILARSYGVQLCHVYDRLARKECTLLPKKVAGFVDEHRDYVRQALEPVLGAIGNSVLEQVDLEISLPDREATERDVKFLAGLLSGSVHRYLEELRWTVISGEERALGDRIETWKNSTKARAASEALRLTNSVAEHLYGIAGKEFEPSRF